MSLGDVLNAYAAVNEGVDPAFCGQSDKVAELIGSL